jgi:hypothetical protein
MAAASPWISYWLDAWKLMSRDVMHLPDAPAPLFILYDSTCVYTTSAVSAAGAPIENGPKLMGAKLPWRALPHHGSITMPDSSSRPVALMSFTNSTKRTGPFFVMAAPSYWPKSKGPDFAATPVFLHEFAHTRQIRGMEKIIGPIDSTWAYPEELDDDAVQTHFQSDSVYVAAYLAERDLLYRAADAPTREDARKFAAQALSMMRDRRARWFTGDKAVFATLDNVFLSLEGSGQWAGYAWLAHPKGGNMDKKAAAAKMVGRGRFWSQDEGLGLMLALDRLLPDWPLLVFRNPSMGAAELLELATRP